MINRPCACCHRGRGDRFKLGMNDSQLHQSHPAHRHEYSFPARQCVLDTIGTGSIERPVRWCTVQTRSSWGCGGIRPGSQTASRQLIHRKTRCGFDQALVTAEVRHQAVRLRAGQRDSSRLRVRRLSGARQTDALAPRIPALATSVTCGVPTRWRARLHELVNGESLCASGLGNAGEIAPARMAALVSLTSGNSAPRSLVAKRPLRDNNRLAFCQTGVARAHRIAAIALSYLLINSYTI